MRHTKDKQFILLLVLLFLVAMCNANSIYTMDGYSHIQIYESQVHGAPKTSSIEATINGHTLIVVFLDDLGQVAVEVSEVGGGETHATSVHTPNGVNFNIPDTGSYIVTFTLPDGDVYYGEFEVTD